MEPHNNNIIQFYQEISLNNSFQKVNSFQNLGKIEINPNSFDSLDLYNEVMKIMNELKNLEIDALLKYRMYTYQQKLLEVIPILKCLNLELDHINEIGSMKVIQQAILNLIDMAIYSLMLEDKSHNTINMVRESLFTLEDYCLQIEHTINLRSQCQSKDYNDDLQQKLIEDKSQMKKYYNQLKKITDLVLKNMQKSA